MREKINTPLEFEKSLLEAAKESDSKSLLHFIVKYGSGSIGVERAIDEVMFIEAKRAQEGNKFKCLFKQQDKDLGDGAVARQTPLEFAVDIMKDKSARSNSPFIDEAALHLAQCLSRIPGDDKHHESAVGQIRSAAASLEGVKGRVANQIRDLADKPRTYFAAVGSRAVAASVADRGIGAAV